MLTRLVNHLWNARQQFARYFIVGVGAMILDIATLYFFKEIMHLNPVTAVVINQVLLFNFVFFLNKYWSFGSKAGATHTQMVRFVILSLINYGIAVGWMWLFTAVWPVRLINPEQDYLLIRLANIALSVGWNFLLYKHWVYKTIENTNQKTA